MMIPYFGFHSYPITSVHFLSFHREKSEENTFHHGQILKDLISHIYEESDEGRVLRDVLSEKCFAYLLVNNSGKALTESLCLAGHL